MELTRTIDPTLLLPEIFSRQAEHCPDRIAAVWRGETLTYADMDEKVEALARGLATRGIGRGKVVGLWMNRSLDLHLALLAILRTGAAYLPFDQAAPAERVAACLADAEAAALIVDQTIAGRTGEQPAAVWTVDQLPLAEGAPVDPRQAGTGPDDPAYMIYTSGSTGTPKGVVISHRNICHYLQAAQTLFRLDPEDVVFQGASIAFDLSLEEIFLPYLAGARLWIADQACLDDTETLAARMTEAGITVLDTVPTLLSLIGADVPSLRVIILGGEACPPALASRWCRPGRHLFNSYGPTETTVVATAAEIAPGDPITIGKPLPGYTAYVVDDRMQRVAPGVEGELLIGGPGVAAGYWRRPELSAQKFITNPFHPDGPDPLLYRTGDAVVEDEEGRLLFRGRIDDQVKIRGFRVELGEIEARLDHEKGIAKSAVALRKEGEFDILAAFVILTPQGLPDIASWKRHLAAQMPGYMIPAHFQVVDQLPILTSGKLNRKALQLIALDAPAAAAGDETPANPIEAVLLAALKPLLPGQKIGFEDDFFLDLGGHSLIAARFVSAVRKTPELAGLTIQDVYAARTLRAMAGLLSGRTAKPRESAAFLPPPWTRRMLCGLAQAVCLPVILALTTAPWLAVFVVYELFTGEEHHFLREVEVVALTYAGINLASALLAIAAKWLILGQTRPGSYPLWGSYYFRWWLVRQLTGMIHLTWFKGTPVLRLLLRMLGAKIGDDAIISDFDAGAIDLVTIGAGASLGSKVQFANAEVIGDRLVIGRITLGDHVVIGSSCVLGHDTEMGEGGELHDLTSLPSGTKTGAWEIWEGSPGRAIGRNDPDALPSPPPIAPITRLAHFALYCALLGILPAVTLIPIIPAFYVLDTLGDWAGEFVALPDLILLPLIAWPAAMALILVTALLVAALRWTLLPVVKAGTYSVHSGFYIRKWTVALATELTLETLSSLFATVYMRNWYRLLGARIGKDSEISANLGGSYDLVEIGAKSFIADEVVISDEDIRHGWMILEPMRTGDRVFVGNSAVMTPGCDLPEGTLIGIKSRPPAKSVPMEENSVWFGSPPIHLPLRQRFDDVASNWTFEPSRGRRIGRAVFEAFSVSFPSMLAITLGSRAVDFLAPAILARNFPALFVQFSLCATAIAVLLLVAAILFKWLMIGAYRPTMKPMWSWWAIRTESVAVNYFGLAGAVLLDHLRGTPMLPPVLNLFGCKLGRGVYMDSVDITEFDCVEVGDYTTINFDGDLQTHLYEDRVMKIGRVKIGTGVSIGSGTTVLYDTSVGDHARIGPLTIVMKGEEIPPNSHWQGAPAQPA